MGIHFGVDYYPEHWPRERWETDAKLMQEMGVQVVRMAEFSWFKMEPSEGNFDFEWLEEAVALLDKYGIKSILGTPSAAPPKALPTILTVFIKRARLPLLMTVALNPTPLPRLRHRFSPPTAFTFIYTPN